MPQPVASPEPVGLRIGLVSGARQPQDPESRWSQGIVYDPFFDSLGGEFPDMALDDDNHVKFVPDVEGDLFKDPEEAQDLNYWLPYTIWLAERCSTFDPFTHTDDFYPPRVRAALEVQTSFRLERSFSTGIIDVGADQYTFAELDLPNRPLYSTASDEVVGGPYGIVEGIALLCEGLAAAIGGARGMIHVPGRLLPYLDYYRQVIRNPSDGRFISLRSHDHTVIAGAGYQGLAPDGTDDSDAGVFWLYATSPVEVRLGEIGPVGTLNDQVATRLNERTVIAERSGLASWDLSAHIAVPVVATDPGPETGS